MMNTKKYRPIFLIILFVLALCLVLTAEARASELFCPEGWQEFVWTADDYERGTFDEDAGSISYTGDGFLIGILRKDYTWSCPFKIPKTGKDYLRWHSNLQVRNATSGINPGISFENDSIGVSFCVDRKRLRGALALVNVHVSVMTIEEFVIPKFDYPCTIGLRYDAVTRELTALLNDAAVKKVKLPYRGIPAFTNIRKVGIETTSSPHTAKGNALYGDMTLWAQ